MPCLAGCSALNSYVLITCMLKAQRAVVLPCCYFIKSRKTQLNEDADTRYTATGNRGTTYWRSISSQGVIMMLAGGKLGADGDEATAAAMRALRDEAKVLQTEKAAKKAAFDAEYDVGELLLRLQRLCCAVHCSAV